MIHNLDRQLQRQQPHCCARYRHALERRYYDHQMSLRMHACSTKAFILIVLILVVSNTSRNRMDVSAFCISSSNDNLNTIRHQYYNGQQHLRSLGNYDQQCDHKHNNNGRPGHVLTNGRRKHITPTIYSTTLFAAIDPTFIDTTIQVLSAQTTTIVSSPSSTILSFPTIGLGLPNINGGIPFLNGISALGAAAIVTSAASLLYTIRTLLLNDRIVEEINEMEFNLTRRRDQEVGQSQKAYVR